MKNDILSSMEFWYNESNRNVQRLDIEANKMSMLQGFEILETVNGVPSMSITKNGISFNKPTLEKLGCPEFVVTLVDKANRRLAIVPCDSHDRGSREFFKPGRDTSYGVRWNNHDLRSTIETMMAWHLKEQGWRVAGIYSEEDNALIFNLEDSEEMSGRKKRQKGGECA